MEKYLTIIEVSQKQLYIFGKKKLQDNLSASGIIEYVTGTMFDKFDSARDKRFLAKEHNFYDCLSGTEGLYSTEKNLVYSGGGHTILNFDSKEAAKEFAQRLSFEVYSNSDFKGVELFIKTIRYDQSLTPSENEKALIDALERKKSIRRAAFGNISFGIEKTDESEEILNPVYQTSVSNQRDAYVDSAGFSELGGTKNKINYVAVVHIDGNNMGAMFTSKKKEFDEECKKITDPEMQWQHYKEKIKALSDEVARDFENTYIRMRQDLIRNLESGKLKELDLKRNHLPLREIIIAGDDICFVADGRIGMECASIFLERLAEIKDENGNCKYSACAGVAVVHTKYPFYKAYELSEELCGNAKKFIALLKQRKSADAQGEVEDIKLSAIDWQYQFGELKDGLAEIRSDYKTADGDQMELRPYLVCGAKEDMALEPVRQYQKFKEFYALVHGEGKDCFAKNKVKELRGALKEGREKTDMYICKNRMHSILVNPINGVFLETDLALAYRDKRLQYGIFLGFNENVKREAAEAAGGNGFLPEEDNRQTNHQTTRCLVYDAIECVGRFIEMDHYSDLEVTQ